MSINYQFTDRGTIQVWCGDDWIEIRLPGGGGGGDAPRPRASAPDLSDPDSGAGPAAVPDDDEPEPEPPGAPASMSIIGMVGARGRRARLLLWPAEAAQRKELSAPEVEIVTEMLSTPQPGEVQILTVDLGQLPLKAPLSVVQLNQLLRAQQLDLGAQESDE